MPRGRPRGRRPAAVLTSCGVCAALAGSLLLWAEPARLADAGALPGLVPDRAGAQPAALPPSPPQLLTLPGRSRTPVVPVAAGADGALRLPEAPDELGWWSLGAQPGAPRGTVLIAGHVDTADGGPGAFAALADVPVADRGGVTTADGRRHGYRIPARRVYDGDALPADLFTTTGPARLALVTCAGPYDDRAGRYEQNLVLYGQPV
ncbi:class F sortase [Streptomyces specialis]|uniref:class F sortase n=1 Tax=Streptomyces specialis TaxID=498367 RepID=UPI00073F7164|nr:class F sortase [Streptomyces specialis]